MWRINIAVQNSRHLLVDQREELALLRYPAADHDALRGEGGDVARQGVGNISSFKVPGGVVGRQRLSRLPPAFFQGGASRQPLEAVAVEWADAGEGIASGGHAG